MSASIGLNPVFADSSLVLKATGVGPINASTRFDQAKIQKALPQLKVKKGTDGIEGEEFPILQIFEGTKLLLTINPDTESGTIFSVVIENNAIRNSVGPGLGAKYQDVFKGKSAPDCTLGEEERSREVYCTSTESPNIVYIFSGDPSGGWFPTPKSMTDRSVQKIAWKPRP